MRLYRLLRSMVNPTCWRCGLAIKREVAKTCTFITLGGPPSDWDIERYASGLHVAVPKEDEHPKTMVPIGRTPDGARGCPPPQIAGSCC